MLLLFARMPGGSCGGQFRSRCACVLWCTSGLLLSAVKPHWWCSHFFMPACVARKPTCWVSRVPAKWPSSSPAWRPITNGSTSSPEGSVHDFILPRCFVWVCLVLSLSFVWWSQQYSVRWVWICMLKQSGWVHLEKRLKIILFFE